MTGFPASSSSTLDSARQDLADQAQYLPLLNEVSDPTLLPSIEAASSEIRHTNPPLPVYNRREALIAGTAVAGAIATHNLTKVADSVGVIERHYPDVIDAYTQETDRLGVWSSLVSEVTPERALHTVISDHPDRECKAGSVNKLAVAVAVLDGIDMKHISPDQRIHITPDMRDHGSDGSRLESAETVKSLLGKMIQGSSNEAMRALQVVMNGGQINKVLRDKGLMHTQLEAVPHHYRYNTGTTTPRDIQKLLTGVANASLLSPESSEQLLYWLRHTEYTNGVKRNLTHAERMRVATKYGHLDDTRNEVGIVFGTDGAPRYFYAFLTHLDKTDIDINMVSTAHSRLGETMAHH